MGQAAVPTAMIVSSMISGAMAPSGQEMQSFEGTGGTDPRTMLGDSRDAIASLMKTFGDQLNAPVTLNSTVPSLPSFVGGGLPFAISAPAQDPAFADPSRLTSPGQNFPTDLITKKPTYVAAPNPNSTTDPGTGITLDNGANFRGGYHRPTGPSGQPSSTTGVDQPSSGIGTITRNPVGGTGTRSEITEGMSDYTNGANFRGGTGTAQPQGQGQPDPNHPDTLNASLQLLMEALSSGGAVQ